MRKTFHISICAVILIGLWLTRPVPAFPGMPPVERTVLPNGLVVLVSPQPALPFVTIRMVVDAGSWRDPEGQAGLANLTASCLILGTAEASVSQINRELDFRGASLDSACDRDYAVVTLRSLKKNLDDTFPIFMESVIRPAFPEEEVRRQKQEILGRIRSLKDQPGRVAENRFLETLYLSGPYRFPVEGTEPSVQNLRQAQVKRFYKTYFRPNVSSLTAVGDITTGEVNRLLEPWLERWEQKAVPPADVTTRFAAGPRTVAVQRDITQANIILGHGGIERSSPDYYAVSVMNRILGRGGLSSRLANKIRVQRGLAYSVYSVFFARKYPGSFRVELQTKNASARKAVSVTLEEMQRIRRKKVSSEELETAQRYLIGSFPLRLDTQSDLCRFISLVEYYHLGLDYADRYPSLIRAVTREDVLDAARKYLHPDNYILTVVGNVQDAGAGWEKAEQGRE